MFYTTRWCAGQDPLNIDNIKLVWDQCLKNISDEDMEGGLDLLKFRSKQYINFPPNPNQFKKLCQEFSNRKRDQVEMLLPPPPRPNISPERIRSHINNCWRALGRLDKIK